MSTEYDDDESAFFSGYQENKQRITGEPEDERSHGQADAWSDDLEAYPPSYDSSADFFGDKTSEKPGMFAPVEEERYDPEPEDETPEPAPEPVAVREEKSDNADKIALFKKIAPVAGFLIVLLILAFTVLPGVFKGEDSSDDGSGVAINTETTAPTSGATDSSTEPTQVNTVAGVPEEVNVPIKVEGGQSPGGQATGTDAIIAYDYAYYFKKDANLAGQFFWNNKPDQATINKNVGKNVSYSLEITPLEVGKLYKVILTLRSGKDVVVWEQEISTEFEDGKYFVSNIKNVRPLPAPR